MSYVIFLICFLIALFATPLVKKLALRVGAVDLPDKRKVHQIIMPRIGGLAIFISFLIGYFLFLPKTLEAGFILLGALIILVIGIIDDIKGLTYKSKIFGQLIAAIIPVAGGIQIEFITLPFGERIEFGYLAVPITIIWIIAITNAINFIDGLDGLAAGVSSIAFVTITGIAVVMGDTLMTIIGLIMLGSTLGFLVFNFYPAKIFMGDTGSLFLGYMISVISVMGLYKNVTLFSLMVPIIILGIPILDTTFAIIRRIIHKKPIASPDKFHLHHCIIRLGFTHRQTVISIYALSGLFSLAAIIFTKSTLWGSTVIILTLIILVELIVEVTGLISIRYRPLLNLIGKPRKME